MVFKERLLSKYSKKSSSTDQKTNYIVFMYWEHLKHAHSHNTHVGTHIHTHTLYM